MGVGEPEKATQKRVIELFTTELGYEYLGDLSRKKNSNIKTKLLEKFLIKKGYSQKLINSAIKELQDSVKNQSLSLYDLNEMTYKKLRYGVKHSESAGQHKRNVYFIDWEKPLENDFYIASEVSIKHKRPDLVLYINGIAFGVIELKRSTVSLAEGIRQSLVNQREDMIMQFFATIGLIMAGNDSEGLCYGTIGTKEKYYLSWKEDIHAKDEVSIAVREQIDKQLLRLDKNLISLCKKERFIELLHNFMIFDSGVKKTCRAHQFFGNMAAREFVRGHKGGIIWHTQGSGKSLSMVWLGKWIKENISNSRILIITDREELDMQIEQVFAGVNEDIERIRGGRELIQKIDDTLPVMMCSLIHKFGKNTDNDDEAAYNSYIEELECLLPEGFSPKGDFYVFVDECHRTQSGKLHRAMKAILPKATFIGFSGTPLMKKDKKSSLEVFGPYIHRYRFDEAVRDKVVLDLRYEAREIEQGVIEQDKIDAWFEAKTRALSDTAKARLKKRWGNMQKIFSSKARLGRIVADIIFDMETKPRLHDGRGNAMLVAGSIYQACKFYELFQETELRGKCAVISSYEPMADAYDEAEAMEQSGIYKKMLNGKDIKAFEAEVKEKFIKQPEQMKLLIVVDKLLTGFDAPPATYLYIDKSMRDHGLFQAICRVNRLDGEDKEFGYIVDYKDLFRSLENAVADYTSEAFDGYDKEDISCLLTERLDKAKEQLEVSLESLRALCEPVALPKDMVDYYHYFCGANTEGFSLEELERNMPKRERLYYLSAKAMRAFGEVVGDLQERYQYSKKQLRELERKVGYYIKLRDSVRLAIGDYVDLKKYDPDMRHLIDTYLSANPSKILMAFEETTLVELLANKGIVALKDMPSSKPKEQRAIAETIENNIGREIVEKSKSNPKYYEKMSALLCELIRKRKNEMIDYKEYLNEIVKLAKKVHNESIGEYPKSIQESAARRAIYDYLSGDEKQAIEVYNAIISSKQDEFRGKKIKELQIERAIIKVVNDKQKAKDLFEIAKNQSEF